MRLRPLGALVLALTTTLSAGESDPRFAGTSFVVYYPTADGHVHRSILRFTKDGASMDLFNGSIIPATGTLTTQRRGRRGTTISAFAAQGEIPYGKGTLAFTAAKDGPGAKGTVTVTVPGTDPVTITFAGQAPVTPR